jgi:hypothetical protein
MALVLRSISTPFGCSAFRGTSGSVWGAMGDVPTNVVAVRLRLLDVWGGDDVIREMSLAELETSERGVAIGPAFYPWRRVVSYEWEVLESEPDEGLARPRQLLVRVLTQGPDGPEEHRVAADRFEVGPWTISMVIPDRVEPETQRTVLRRITLPWYRVLEYERMLAEAKTAAEVPDRPDLEDTPQLTDGVSSAGPVSDDDGPVVIDVAAVEHDAAAIGEDEVAAEHDAAAIGEDAEPSDGEVEPADDDESDDREPVAVGSGARVKKSVPRKTGQRRKRPRSSS